MTALLDTNVLIRDFTGDPPAQARRATANLKAAAAEELTRLDLHVAECVNVLEGPYRQRRSDVCRLMGSVLGLQSVFCSRMNGLSCGRSTCTSTAVSTSPTRTSSPEPRRRASGVSWGLTASTPSWVERPEFAALNPDCRNNGCHRDLSSARPQRPNRVAPGRLPGAHGHRRGTGVPVQEHERIFERLHSGDNVRGTEGTSLGLSIGWALARGHRGDVIVRSVSRKEGQQLHPPPAAGVLEARTLHPARPSTVRVARPAAGRPLNVPESQPVRPAVWRGRPRGGRDRLRSLRRRSPAGQSRISSV